MNPSKLKELRALLAAAANFEDVMNAKTRVMAFLRLEHTKDEVEDFKSIHPPPSFGGVDQAGAMAWKATLLAYLDGLLDAG